MGSTGSMSFQLQTIIVTEGNTKHYPKQQPGRITANVRRISIEPEILSCYWLHISLFLAAVAVTPTQFSWLFAPPTNPAMHLREKFLL